MGYKYFKTVCTLRVLGIVLTTGILFRLRQAGLVFPLLIAAGILLIYQTVSLIRFIQKTNRDLTRFLDAVRYEDFSLTFKKDGDKSTFSQLAGAFSGIIDKIAGYRTRTEEHYQYLRTVVQHIGIGMISFEEDGKVGFINNAGLKIFQINRLNHIQDLDSLSPDLSGTINSMENGQHQSAADLITGVDSEIASFTSDLPPHDDITMITLKIC